MRQKCNIKDRKTTNYDKQIPIGKGLGWAEVAAGLALRAGVRLQNRRLK
jgi:hypothetical protein